MLGTRAAFALFASLTIAESSCCCLRWLPEIPELATEEDEPAIERAARARAETEGRELLTRGEAPIEEDAGIEDSGVKDAGQEDAGVPDAGQDEEPRRDCVSGVGALALDLGVAVITRGHAGGDAAAQVTFNPGACARRLVVHVVKHAAGWTVVAMVVYDTMTETEIERVGTVPEFSETIDSDFGSDEMF